MASQLLQIKNRGYLGIPCSFSHAFGLRLWEREGGAGLKEGKQVKKGFFLSFNCSLLFGGG